MLIVLCVAFYCYSGCSIVVLDVVMSNVVLPFQQFENKASKKLGNITSDVAAGSNCKISWCV
jgi:hypothetical protein